MSLSPEQLWELGEVARVAVAEAGAHVRARSGGPLDVRAKAGGGSAAAQVVTEVDLECEELIAAALRPSVERHGLGMLTEETGDDGSRLSAGYFWCVDPLDGTLPFTEGVPGYAVSVALVGRDGVPFVGAVHDPVESATFHAVRGAGLFRDGAPWRPATSGGERGGPLTVVADRSFLRMDSWEPVRRGLESAAVARGLDGLKLVAHGGAVMNALWVLQAPPALYLKLPRTTPGGGSAWDFAATACIFGEAGAVAGDVSGAPLELNRSGCTSLGHRGVLYATDGGTAALAREVAAAVGG